MPTSPPMIGPALELADLLRPSWPEFDTGHLVCEGDDEAAAKKAADDAAAAKAAADKEKADAEAAEAKRKADAEFDPERAKATIAAQRESENKLKAELKAAKEKAAKYDAEQAEKLSEQEKAAKRAEEAEAKEAKATERLRKANLVSALSKPEHGIVNAAAAAKLIEGVEYDDDDEPTNVAALLPDFLTANSFLKGEAAPPADFGGGARGGSQGAAKLTDDELNMAKSSGMTPEEYALWRDDPQAAAAAAEKAKEAAAAAAS